MKYFKKQKKNNIFLILAIFFLTPMIAIYLFPKISLKDKKHLEDLGDKYGMSGVEYVALEYESRTGRNLLIDSFLSALCVGLTGSYLLIKIIIWKHS